MHIQFLDFPFYSQWKGVHFPCILIINSRFAVYREIPCRLVFVIKFDTHTTHVLSQMRNMIPFLLTMDGKAYVSLHTHNVCKDGWSCNWPSVSNLVIFERAVMIFKIVNGLCPDNLRGRLVTRSQIPNYPARNQLDLGTPRQSLEFSKSSFLLWCKDVE